MPKPLPPPLGFGSDLLRWATSFYEAVARFIGAGIFRYPDLITFADQDATPTVAGGNIFQEANTLATTITDFDDGADQQPITILFTTANTTIADGANIQLSGGANFVGSANDILELIHLDGVFYERSRSLN